MVSDQSGIKLSIDTLDFFPPQATFVQKSLDKCKWLIIKKAVNGREDRLFLKMFIVPRGKLTVNTLLKIRHT